VILQGASVTQKRHRRRRSRRRRRRRRCSHRHRGLLRERRLLVGFRLVGEKGMGGARRDQKAAAGGTYAVGSGYPVFVQGRTTSPFHEQPSIDERIQAPSFLPKFFAPLYPSRPSSIHRHSSLFRRIAVGGVTCFSTLRDLALSSPRGHIPSSFHPSRLPPFRYPSRVTRKTRSCEQFFFSSPILQILLVCE